MEIILVCFICVDLIVLLIQSVIFYKAYRTNLKILKAKNPTLDKNSDEWKAFSDLFNKRKVDNEGYIRVLSRDCEEEVMLNFNCFGSGGDYHNGEHSLTHLTFEYDGNRYDGYGDLNPARLASYDLYVDDIASISEIQEGGYYFNNEVNTYHVDCLLKDGRTVQLIFSYKRVEE